MFSSVLAVLLVVGNAVPPPPQPTSIPLQAGDRIRVRHDTGLATIIGGPGKTLDVAILPGSVRDHDDLRMRRVDPRTWEVSTNGPTTLWLPRATELEVITSARASVNVRGVRSVKVQATSGNVRLDDIEGNIDATLGSANLTLKNVGGNVVATSSNGNIAADRVGGLVDVTTGNGNAILTNVRNGVHVVTINGKTEITCAAGAIDVKDTSGRVTVRNAAEDVEIFTALGQAFYEGTLQPDRSYRLRTLDGAVTLTYAANGAGFTARVASDAGNIEMDSGSGGKRQRQDIRVGDQSARVVLDAVGGRVALRKDGATSSGCAPWK